MRVETSPPKRFWFSWLQIHFNNFIVFDHRLNTAINNTLLNSFQSLNCCHRLENEFDPEIRRTKRTVCECGT